MDLQLLNKNAIVTGAGRGIGLAVVNALLAEGTRVTAVSRTNTPETSQLEADDRFRFLAPDLNDPGDITRVAEQIGSPVDILVNNVGSAPPRPGGFETITDEDWLHTLSLNTLAAVRLTRALLSSLPRGGTILNIVSENAILADPLVMDYSAAKAALLSFTKSLSKELGPRGITVNSISPGPVATALWLGASGVAAAVSRAKGGSAEDVRHGAEQAMVTGRFTQPQEVGTLVAMAVSPRIGNMTGADLVIDGGMRPTM